MKICIYGRLNGEHVEKMLDEPNIKNMIYFEMTIPSLEKKARKIPNRAGWTNYG